MIKRPYHLLLITATLLFIVSFWHKNDSIDFHLHDTYFVFSGVYYVMSLFFLSCWGIYRLTEKFLLTKYLTWLHVIITISILIYCLTPDFYKTAPVSYVELGSYNWYYQIAAVLVGAQIGFVVNLLGGLIRKVYN